MYLYMYVRMYTVTYTYTCVDMWTHSCEPLGSSLADSARPLPPGAPARGPHRWVSIKGGVQWEGVQWIGVVLYNKLVHNIINHYTLFPLHPPLMNREQGTPHPRPEQISRPYQCLIRRTCVMMYFHLSRFTFSGNRMSKSPPGITMSSDNAS